MRTTLFALSLSLLTAPAAAAPSGDAGSRPTKSSTAKETEYCIDLEPGTGSRISRRECHTKKQWDVLGVDIGKLIKG